MKIAVVSDTHGFINKTLKALRKIKNLDLIIHLGDYVKDAREIERQLNLEVIYIRGNCDYSEMKVELEKVLKIENKNIFITHGHNYDVKNGVSKIFYRAKEINSDIVLFGHSHMSMILEYEDVLILNPGSPEQPRNGNQGSIGLIEISENDIKSEIIMV